MMVRFVVTCFGALAAAFVLATGAAARPLVVILADVEGREAPDLLIPYAILAESGAVEVKVVSADRPARSADAGHGLGPTPQMTWRSWLRERPHRAPTW